MTLEPSPTKNPNINKPILGVSVLISCRDHVLLAKRGKEPGKGLWSLPGGKVEWGETLEQAAHREVSEECNLTLDQLNFAEFVEIISSDLHFVIGVFTTTTTTCEPVKAGDDAAEVRWFQPEAMAELNNAKKMTPGTYRRICKLTTVL